MTIFRGLSAFPITPADANGRVIAAAVRTIVGRIVDAGVDSICVLGSTGGYAYLTPISGASWSRKRPGRSVEGCR